jgi:hypothetical protein
VYGPVLQISWRLEGSPTTTVGRSKTGPGISAVSADAVYVIDSDDTLWLTPGPFGQVPNPKRIPVDANAIAWSAVEYPTTAFLHSRNFRRFNTRSAKRGLSPTAIGVSLVASFRAYPIR